MTTYEIQLAIEVEADSKFDAFNRVRNALIDIAKLRLSSDVDAEMFAEIGIDYDPWADNDDDPWAGI